MSGIVESNSPFSLFLNEDQELAFLRLPDGSLGIGIGPFEASAHVPESPAFYVNDFALSDERPWKTPSKFFKFSADEVCSKWSENGSAADDVLRIDWKILEPEWFEMVFRRIRRDVVAKRLRKMVPVLTKQGRLVSGSHREFFRRVLASPRGLWAYGHLSSNEGFAGATPELLLSIRGNRLETMALAGTASPVEKPGSFAVDAKEIEEHELVAGFIESALSSLGQVHRSAREVSDAAGLTHFRTRLSVETSHPLDLTDLVKLLHPTPAVGCLPREEATLTKLMEYRRQLHAPEHFGAPFGLKTENEFHVVVAIRGISWKHDQISMPSGCGVVAGSVFDHEWRELKQKREAVARMLGV